MGFSRQEHWSGLPFSSPMHESGKWKWSRSVVSDSSRPHGLQPTRLLHPWDFPGKSTGVGWGKKWKQWQISLFLGSKIIVDADCSHEIKRCLLLGRKAMTSLDSIWKSRDITLQTKIHLVKAMVSPVVMHGCESWTIKKAECWRTVSWVSWVLLDCDVEEDLWESLGLQGDHTSQS